jgi:hypothetical protein
MEDGFSKRVESGKWKVQSAARGFSFHFLAHKTAPVLIPTMHLTGGIADGLFALELFTLNLSPLGLA